ncbi:hypothetical protein LguiB_014112 [Lonicera macranthoides]
MSNITKLEFKTLELNGNNYLNWQFDAKLHLTAKNLGDAIVEGNKLSSQDKASALIFLRHHIHDDLKNEYMTEEDPLGLWQSLKDRYDHQKLVILPSARNEWINLRFQDFKTVAEYNSSLFNIIARLRLCDEKVTEEQMIEKTLSTFHAQNVLLQQQYRERRFSTYAELVSCLLVAEQNNKVLIKNHNSRPTGSEAIPEANVNFGHNRSRGNGRNNPPRRGGYKNSSGRGGRNNYPSRGGYKGPHNNTKFKNHQKWSGKKNENQNKNQNQDQNQNPPNNNCHRCGKSGHWSRACRAPKHVVDQYKASINAMETNWLDGEENDTSISATDIIQLKCNDFFEDADGNPVTKEKFDEMLGAPPS